MTTWNIGGFPLQVYVVWMEDSERAQPPQVTQSHNKW